MPIVYPDAAKSKGLDAKFDMNSMANQIMLMVLSAVAEIEHATIKDRFAAGKLTGPLAATPLADLRPTAFGMLR